MTNLEVASAGRLRNGGGRVVRVRGDPVEVLGASEHEENRESVLDLLHVLVLEMRQRRSSQELASALAAFGRAKNLLSKEVLVKRSRRLRTTVLRTNRQVELERFWRQGIVEAGQSFSLVCAGPMS